MMKRTPALLLLVAIIVGCQDDLLLRNTGSFNELLTVGTKASGDDCVVDSLGNDHYIFLAEKDFNAWTKIKGFTNRLKACEVPDDVLQAMSTEALVKSAIAYPLNYLLFAYEDPREAIDIIVENSSLHKELLDRNDAVKTIVKYYANNLPSMRYDWDQRTGVKETLPFEADYFLGVFLGLIISSDAEIKLENEAISLLKEKKHTLETNQDKYGSLSLEPISYLFATLEHEQVADNPRSGGEVLGTIQIYTPFRQNLLGETISELSPDQIYYLDSLAIANFPDATMIGHSSACYNGHSYAWYLSTTNNTVWLKKYNPSSLLMQLDKYWTNDLYESCQSSSAQKVYFPSGYGHSAIVCSNGKLRSKWERFPLMEHDLSDCPFDTSSPQYYKEKGLPRTDDLISITGPSYVAPNVSNTYLISYPSNNNVHYYVTAESLNPSDTVTLTHIGGNTYTLVCSNYGAYNISVQGYAGLNDCYFYSYENYLVICSGI